MEALIFILVAGALFVLFVLPLIAFSKASGAQREFRQSSELTRQLERQLNELKMRLDHYTANRTAPTDTTKPTAATSAGPSNADEAIDRLQVAKETTRRTTHPETLPPVLTSDSVSAPPPLPPRHPRSTPSPASGRLRPALAEPAPENATGSPRPATETPGKSMLENINWEQFMGVRLFAWLGGFALFLAAGFFLKYSFDHGLIPPWLRVTLGFLTGVCLLIGGVRISQKRYKITADTLSATGVVILYAVTFACRSVYEFEFFSLIRTFALMAIITATAFLTAVRLNALVVAVLGMLGGFLTPILLSTGHDNPFGLFSYVALLDVGLLAVAYARRWHWLNLAGAVGTVIMQFGWAGKFFAPEKVFIAMTVFLGFCFLYLAATVWSRQRARSNLPLIAGTLAMPAATFLFTTALISDATLGMRPGVVFSFLLGADLAVLALAATHTRATPSPTPGTTPAERSDHPSQLPGLGWLGQISGAIVFLLLAAWTVRRVDESLLFWALGGSLILAGLHTVFPIVLRRLHPDQPVAAWTQLFPIAGLFVMLIPILKFESVSFLLWPFVLLVDLIAIAAAVLMASIGGIAIALVATVFVALVWLARMPAEWTDLPQMLTVIVVLAGVFTVAGTIAGRNILNAQLKEGPNGDRAFIPPGWAPADVQQQVPALSGIMPFLLLVVVTGRVPMENPSPVFGVALLIVGLLLGLTRLAGMNWLPAIGLGCTFLVEFAWQARNASPESPGLVVGWYLAFYAVFALYPFVFHRRDGTRLLAWISSAASAPVQFWLVYETVRRNWPNDYMGAVPAAFAVPAFLALIVVVKLIPGEQPQRNTLLAWFGGVALLFVTLIFPIQFDHEWLTISWALEGAALLWLFHRVPHQGLRHVGVGLLVLSFIRLALNPAVLEYHPRSGTALLNWYLYTYGAVIAALFFGAGWMAPPNHRLLKSDARALLVTLGTILAFLLMNIEIADYFSGEGERVLTFSFRGNFARDLCYTIGWALFALAQLVIGILRRVRPARLAGISLLAVTLLKLFFHDLATLNQLYRVGALVGVAVIAIVASFLYQKFLGAETSKGLNPDEFRDT